MNRDYYCFFNGDLVKYKHVQIHVSDLQIQRGYGIFDYFRSRNGELLWLEDYQDRLFTSIALAGLEVGVDRSQFRTIIQDLHRRNGLANGAFKIMVTGGYSDTLDSISGPPNFLVLNIPWIQPPEKDFTAGVGLISEHFLRPNPEIKTLYYFNTLRLNKRLHVYQAVDVLFHTDTITEASRANLFFVRDNQVFTPSRDILEGITRRQVLSLLDEVQFAAIGIGQLFEFDEVFLTSTSRDITPVISVDGREIGSGKPGPVTREIQALFRAKGW